MFDRTVAEAYDSWFDTPLGAFVDQTETRCAFGLLKPLPGERVLDVGCGTGNFSLKLAEAGARVTGVDLSEDMLAVARRRGAEEGQSIEFFRTAGEELPFEDGSFDAAITMATLEFVGDPEKVLGEMLRVTCLGGRVVVGVINRDSPWGELYTRVGKEGDPVFKDARLMNQSEAVSLRPKGTPAVTPPETVAPCLYVPPDASEEAIGWEKEDAGREAGVPPGFLCVRWRKTK
jgi:ubiquinone/menaquinone biosynthesis C-methylase UbiE